MNHCLSIKFHRPSEKDIKERINSIFKSEKFTINDESLS
jgi:hypothetical protein